MELTAGEINYLEKDTTFLNKCNNVNIISLILQGEVKYQDHEYCSGQFIGIHGLVDGVHNITYTASTDVILRVFDVSSIKEFVELFMQDNQLQEDMFIELNTLINQFVELYGPLYQQTLNLYQSIVAVKKHYLQHCEKLNYSAINIPIGKEILNFKLYEQSFYEDYHYLNELTSDLDKLYKLLATDKSKLLTKQLSTILNIYKLYFKLKSYIQRLTTVFVNSEEISLFKAITELAEYAAQIQEEKTYLVRLLETIYNLLKATENKLMLESNLSLYIDYHFIDSCMLRVNKFKKRLDNHPLNNPENSLTNLMNYAQFDSEKQTVFTKLMDFYFNLPDKYSKEDTQRNLCKQICILYYELYEAVFLQSVIDTNHYTIVNLFLNYGFLDERLLTDDQIDTMINYEDTMIEASPCEIYRMKDWLTNIYKGLNTPSKSEFDEDYYDFVRKKKNSEGLTKAQEFSLLNNGELKVKFEIENMLRYNNRLINGNLSSFVPFLIKENFEYQFRSMFVEQESLISCINSIIDIDYSLFYRELLYANESAKIKKEYIQKEIYPIFILFPTYGVNGIMWQEVTRKKSDSQGRIFLPALTNVNLEDILLKVLGRFRWELCKNQQGLAWNNIRIPSLTSEYSDYIQFYMKNKELSQQKKDSLKSDISKYRNNIRDIFVNDYIIWIKYESSGSIRLNNVARRILSTYCPFSKDIREKLERQPLFNKAMVKYNLQKAKKIKELHNRYTTLSNNGSVITQELIVTEKFYKDL